MRLAFASLAIAAVGFGTSTAVSDTFTAGVATSWVDPDTGAPDFADLNLYTFGATTFPGFTPTTDSGPTALFNLVTQSASAYRVAATTADLGNGMFQVTVDWSTSDGGSFFSHIEPLAMTLPSGRTANIQYFDIGFRTGGGPFPADGIALGTEWMVESGTQTFFDTMGGEETTAINFGTSPFPYPDPTAFYQTAGLGIDFLESSNLNGINYVFNIQAVPAPGALALLGMAGLAGRRRRD
ncbi:MAG: hypothetical protein P8I44_11110 [Phycisphaerales bacterium]|nr:hypothetical protein [Phycisphaerales bacterium]